MPSLRKKLLRQRGDKAKCKAGEVTGSKLGCGCWGLPQFSVVSEWVRTRQITGPRTVPRVLLAPSWPTLHSRTRTTAGYLLSAWTTFWMLRGVLVLIAWDSTYFTIYLDEQSPLQVCSGGSISRWRPVVLNRTLRTAGPWREEPASLPSFCSLIWLKTL